jgi:hypothetical protein
MTQRVEDAAVESDNHQADKIQVEAKEIMTLVHRRRVLPTDVDTEIRRPRSSSRAEGGGDTSGGDTSQQLKSEQDQAEYEGISQKLEAKNRTANGTAGSSRLR